MAASRRWVRDFAPEMLQEIDAALRAVQRRGIAWHGVTRETFPLVHTATLLAEAAAELEGLSPLAGAVNASFFPGSVVVTGGSLPAERPAEDALHTAALGLRDALSWSVPALARAKLLSAWFGVRSRRQTGVPVLRRLAPKVTYYGGLAGRGFLCAADLSAKLAERLLA